MKKILLTITGFLLILVTGYAQEVKEETQNQSKADVAAKNTQPFSTNYFQSKENQHFVVILNINDGMISRELPKVEMRPGKIQKKYTSGSFKVAWLSREGEELGNYSMEDPTIVRTWEKPEIKKIPKGKVELVLPKDSKISTLVLFQEGKETNRWSIEEQIKRISER